jgi:hypothetical protein
VGARDWAGHKLLLPFWRIGCPKGNGPLAAPLTALAMVLPSVRNLFVGTTMTAGSGLEIVQGFADEALRRIHVCSMISIILRVMVAGEGLEPPTPGL